MGTANDAILSFEHPSPKSRRRSLTKAARILGLVADDNSTNSYLVPSHENNVEYERLGDSLDPVIVTRKLLSPKLLIRRSSFTSWYRYTQTSCKCFI